MILVPSQARSVRTILLGWPRKEIERSVHLVLPDGRTFSAGEALHGTLELLPVVGPIFRHLSARVAARRIVMTLYNMGVALRIATQCSAPA